MRAGVFAALLLIGLPVSAAELRGHGGPVRALAVADAETVVSGSFDTTVIVWSLSRATALSVRQFHNGSVNAVAALPDGRFVSAGEDGRIAVWERATDRPVRVLEGHTAPVAALAVAPDGAKIASASWDGTARIWPTNGSEPRILSGHQGNVNGVVFLDNGAIATAGYDATLRVWPEVGPPTVKIFPSPLNTLAVLPDGHLVLGGSDGRVRLATPDGALTREVQITETPVTALAVSPNGKHIAAAGIRGAIAIVAADSLHIERTLVGPGLPVWSLAFTTDSRELLTGGSDRVIRRWNVTTGELIGPLVTGGTPDPLAAFSGDRGADVFRACIACHALQPGEGMRAGPSLHNIMGRKIGTLQGYSYSPGFRDLGIVWTKATIAKLFELGPRAYTPGTKMPEQKVTREEDRRALVEFLERATR